MDKGLLLCPYCDYIFAAAAMDCDFAVEILMVCPKCSLQFITIRDCRGVFYTSKDCVSNRSRHAWEYKKTEGYDVDKECVRCGKRIARPAQKKLFNLLQYPSFEKNLLTNQNKLCRLIGVCSAASI